MSSERYRQTLLASENQHVVAVRHQYFQDFWRGLQGFHNLREVTLLVWSGPWWRGWSEPSSSSARLLAAMTSQASSTKGPRPVFFGGGLVSTPWRSLCIPRVEVSTRERLKAAKKPHVKSAYPGPGRSAGSVERCRCQIHIPVLHPNRSDGILFLVPKHSVKGSLGER